MENFPTLKHLNISKCKNIKPEGIALIRDGFPHLTSLSACQIESTTISQSLTALIRSHRDTLQQVEVSEIRWASASLMTEISLLKYLTKLDISDTMLAGTTKFLAFLRQHSKKLRVLRMSFCGFSAKSVSVRELNPCLQSLFSLFARVEK